MAKFFVGHRVRIRYMREPAWDCLTGCEGVVVAIGPFAVDMYRLRGDYRVQADGDYGLPAQLLAEQLEPILDQHQPCEADFKESLDKLLDGLPA